MSMQQIMRWGHDFLKIKGGGIFNLWGQWGKAKCQRENQWNSQPPFLSHSPNHLILAKIGWSSYCMGMGRVWAGNSNLGETHFWGKSILTFGASKHPKCMPIWPYINIIHFSSCREAWELFSPPQFFLWYVLLHELELLGIFIIIIHPRWGSLKRLGICWVWNPWFWICCVFLPHVGSCSSFSGGWEFHFCDVLMVGFFPNDFCCISPMFTKLKIVFVLSSDFEERPHPLECCWWIHFLATLGPKGPCDTTCC